MTPTRHTDAAALLAFNQQLLDQALVLVAAHDGPGAPRYAGPAGAHLRHVVEHLEALLMPARRGEVDYDSRPRDRELESCSQQARQRLLALHALLAQTPPDGLDTPLRVHGPSGLGGFSTYTVGSSLGRELAFVASHAVHHFALLAAYCQQHHIATPTDFGKAPATVAHERASRSAPAPRTIEEVSSCSAQPLPA